MPCQRFFFALPLLAAAAAHAAPLKVLGLDDMSCAGWIRSRSEPEPQLPYIHWVRGFLSGHNYALQATQVSVVSSGTVAAYLDRYCRLKPDGSIAEAAMRMSDEFSGRNAAIRK